MPRKKVEKETKPETTSAPLGMESLQDYVVPLRLEVGRSKITLDSALNLTNGSILELDSHVGEDLSVYMGEKLIAKGEVVVVDERFGVRILELVK